MLQAAGVTTPVPIDIWWTPSHYGDASADEYAEIKRALETERPVQGDAEVGGVGAVQRPPGKRYNAFQLGWFPDYLDAEDYIVPFYQPDNFMANGYNSPKMNGLIKAETGRRPSAARWACCGASGARRQGCPIIPYWQGKMIAVSRSNVNGIPGTLDPRHHAVLS